MHAVARERAVASYRSHSPRLADFVVDRVTPRSGDGISIIGRGGPTAIPTTKDIAAKANVPSAYLAKVLQSMRRGGLIHSRRGVGGGVPT